MIEILLVLLSATCLLLVLGTFLAWSRYSRVVQARNLARTRFEKFKDESELRTTSLLAELDDLFHVRTGLSTSLIHHALGAEHSLDYKKQSTDFMQAAVDTTQRILTNLTGDDCAVSIKLLTPTAGQSEPTITTYFRDRRSEKIRAVEYSKLEPYDFRANSLMKEIVDSDPPQNFVFWNSLVNYPGGYSNPNPKWKDHFRASAIHRICDPNATGSPQTFGFLCVDNNLGGFNPGETRRILSIVSSATFYCLFATSALESTKG